MSDPDPFKTGFTHRGCLVVHHRTARDSSAWLSYLKTTFQFIPPNDDHRTIFYQFFTSEKSCQGVVTFSLHTHLNMFILRTESETVPPGSVEWLECIESVISILKSMIRWERPNPLRYAKFEHLIGYKLVAYLPDNVAIPSEMKADVHCLTDFFGNELSKRLRLFIYHIPVE